MLRLYRCGNRISLFTHRLYTPSVLGFLLTMESLPGHPSSDLRITSIATIVVFLNRNIHIQDIFIVAVMSRPLTYVIAGYRTFGSADMGPTADIYPHFLPNPRPHLTCIFPNNFVHQFITQLHKHYRYIHCNRPQLHHCKGCPDVVSYRRRGRMINIDPIIQIRWSASLRFAFHTNSGFFTTRS
jgi:hypothetical protein